MDTHQYVTEPDGTIHLCRSGDPTAALRTRCGLTPAEAWEEGDETQSGHRANCTRCRQVAQPDRGPGSTGEAADAGPVPDGLGRRPGRREHAYDGDTDRCRCGAEVMYFEAEQTHGCEAAGPLFFAGLPLGPRLQVIER